MKGGPLYKAQSLASYNEGRTIVQGSESSIQDNTTLRFRSIWYQFAVAMILFL